MQKSEENICILSGTPENIGMKYGDVFKAGISHNKKALLEDTGTLEKYEKDSQFRDWLKRNEEKAAELWPLLITEMEYVAKSSGFDYSVILMLNMRSWSYETLRSYLKTDSVHACSSIAIKLTDGTVGIGGSLDDPPHLYCGPVKFVPEKGFRFITFPITGTVWGNRGMNSEGLALSLSSQSLVGLEASYYAINFDLPLRVILQTCSVVDEVRDFCEKHHFNANLLCSDSKGGIICIHNTAAGMYEIPAEKYAVITNHIIDDHTAYQLARKGVSDYSVMGAASRQRRGYLLDFAYRHDRECTFEELIDMLAQRDDDNPGIINTKGTYMLTCSNPQKYKDILWIKRGGAISGEPSGPSAGVPGGMLTSGRAGFIPFKI